MKFSLVHTFQGSSDVHHLPRITPLLYYFAVELFNYFPSKSTDGSLSPFGSSTPFPSCKLISLQISRNFFRFIAYCDTLLGFTTTIVDSSSASLPLVEISMWFDVGAALDVLLIVPLLPELYTSPIVHDQCPNHALSHHARLNRP